MCHRPGPVALPCFVAADRRSRAIRRAVSAGVRAGCIRTGITLTGCGGGSRTGGEAGNPNLVDTVFVDGELMKHEGRLLGHDGAKGRLQAEEARNRVLERAGVTDPGLWQPAVYAAPSE